MEQATRNYLSLTNDAIEEAGSDLASFAVDGSDFLTNTDAMMGRFKKWTMRAWRDIQQESLDWEWMSGQGIVNLVPGIMFYSVYPPVELDFDYTATIYDVDGTVKVSPLTVTHLVPLTGIVTDTLNYGYVKLDSSGDSPLSFGMKAGGEYMFAPANLNLDFTSTSLAVSRTGGTGGSVFGQPVSSLAWLASDGYGNLHSDTVQIQGTVDVPYNTSRFSIDITGGLGEWWSHSFADALQDSRFFNVTLAITMEDGTIISMTPTDSSNNNRATLTQVPEPYITYPDTVTIGYFGNGVNVSGGIAAGTLIDSIVVANSASGNGTYLNDGVCTYVNTNRFFVEINNFTFLGINTSPSFGNTSTITFKSGGVTKAVVSLAANGTLWNWSYFPTLTGDPGKMYIHSWRSYDFSDETDQDDFVEDIREINSTTFRIIYHEDPAISSELPLQFLPWSSFQNKFDFASTTCSTPRIITEDNQGRYRFYPPMDRPYTLLFNYVREPQVFVNATDVPKGLPEEYTDLIMWRTIAYYGEYDEQPSVAMRAWKNYKTLLMKFEMQTREKFHFKSAYSWGSRVVGS